MCEIIEAEVEVDKLRKEESIKNRRARHNERNKIIKEGTYENPGKGRHLRKINSMGDNFSTFRISGYNSQGNNSTSSNNNYTNSNPRGGLRRDEYNRLRKEEANEAKRLRESRKEEANRLREEKLEDQKRRAEEMIRLNRERLNIRSKEQRGLTLDPNWSEEQKKGMIDTFFGRSDSNILSSNSVKTTLPSISSLGVLPLNSSNNTLPTMFNDKLVYPYNSSVYADKGVIIMEPRRGFVVVHPPVNNNSSFMKPQISNPLINNNFQNNSQDNVSTSNNYTYNNEDNNGRNSK